MRYGWTMIRFAIVLSVGICLFFAQARASVGGLDLMSGKSIDVKSGKKGEVVVFMSAKCPCSNSHVAILKKLAKDYPGFSFVAVHSNVDEAKELTQEYFKKVDLPFPVIQDDGARIADVYKAFKTPHAFVVGPDGKTLYQGGVTNSHNGESADRNYLREALADLEAGRAVKTAEGRTLGCAISRGEKFVW